MYSAIYWEKIRVNENLFCLFVLFLAASFLMMGVAAEYNWQPVEGTALVQMSSNWKGLFLQLGVFGPFYAALLKLVWSFYRRIVQKI